MYFVINVLLVIEVMEDINVFALSDFLQMQHDRGWLTLTVKR